MINQHPLIPSIQLGNIEVISIDESNQSLKMLVHIKSSDSISEIVPTLVMPIAKTIKYMEAEGFIGKHESWNTQMTIIKTLQ